MVNISKLKARLKEKNMTQEELSKKLGMNPATLNKKINNEIGEHLTIEEATKLKDILEIPTSEVEEYFFKD